VRVLIDTTFARRAPLSGTGIYIRRVCEALQRRDGVEAIEVANPHRRPPAGGGLGSARNLVVDQWWTAVALPRLARRHGAELVHHPLPAWSPGVRQLVTVVDLAFERLPAHFDRGYRTYAHHLHRAAARRAAGVICISQSVAEDVERLWRVPAGRITVALLGPGQELPPGGPPVEEPQHLLYVGDDEPRKNLGVLIDAYARYRSRVTDPLPLVLAGRGLTGRVRDASPGVIAVADPDGARLGELYRGAAALVHPSLLEGFGLTPLEAMRLGTPVIAARSPGITEVCGDAARYCDPHDAAAFAAAIAELAADRGARLALRARGIRRAGRFSWAECARAHVDAYSVALL
jgi:glycosyltransferase involved in cell wall biosynthesis